jgi:hypothetical protein
MAYSDIPAELQKLQQWICWSYEDIGAKKPTKVPYDPKSGKMASVNEPDSWSTFDEAVKTANKYSGIGLVFTDNDPYTFIDLDDTDGNTIAYDRQIKVFREFDSWSEVSPSGRGLHIIVKGIVPAGRRRNFIEIYSSQRYATFTGNVHNDKPIKECQDKLIQLWEQMGSGGIATNVYKGDDKEKFNDKEIIEQASNATNGEKFKELYNGKWQDIYQSQSEADFAFIDIVSFYTQNKNQISRIFYGSQLGKRDKAKRKDYIAWMINKSFDRMLPPIDFDGFKIALEQKIAERDQLKLPLGKEGDAIDRRSAATPKLDTQPLSVITEAPIGADHISIPPGLLGEIAQFIYAAAPRPVPEIALAAAIGLMAGIAGRAYNISNMGLNQYVLLLAMTGTGKEAMASGIDRLMNTIKLQVPTSSGFIGPSEIASGQALLKYIYKSSQCFVSILGEFGIRLEIMSNPHANSAEKALKKVLLDLYNKSGYGQNCRASIFADSDKNTNVIESPAFSILGESTPERFYNALNEDMISEGLLPRFLLIEYSGHRPDLSLTHTTAVPSYILTDKLSALVANVEQIMHSKRVVTVHLAPDAVEIQAKFDKYATAQINNTHKEIIKQLWNRAHVKVLKLSALIAVGVNMTDPVVLPEYIKWAMELVQHDIRALSEKFEQGLIGSNTYEIRQVAEVARMMKEYLLKDYETIKKYMVLATMSQLMHNAKVIPYAYLSKRLVSMACFRNDRQGATVGLKRALQVLIDSDKIREVNKLELINKFGTTQRAFMVRDISILD